MAQEAPRFVIKKDEDPANFLQNILENTDYDRYGVVVFSVEGGVETTGLAVSENPLPNPFLLPVRTVQTKNCKIFEMFFEEQNEPPKSLVDYFQAAAGVEIPPNCANDDDRAWKNLEMRASIFNETEHFKQPHLRSRKYVKKMHEKNPLYIVSLAKTLFAPDEPWNFTNFTQSHSIIHGATHAKNKIPGVQSPYLLIGNRYTWFCMHCEDSDLASLNYLHEGVPKHWIFVPLSQRSKLQKLIMKTINSNGRKYDCPTAYRHKCFIITEDSLKKHNIIYTKVIQNPGDFIISLYGATHQGFQDGYNAAEAMNIASPRYIDFYRNSTICKVNIPRSNLKCEYAEKTTLLHKKLKIILENYQATVAANDIINTENEHQQRELNELFANTRNIETEQENSDDDDNDDDDEIDNAIENMSMTAEANDENVDESTSMQQQSELNSTIESENDNAALTTASPTTHALNEEHEFRNFAVNEGASTSTGVSFSETARKTKKIIKNKKVTAAVKKDIKKRKPIAKKSDASGVNCALTTASPTTHALNEEDNTSSTGDFTSTPCNFAVNEGASTSTGVSFSETARKTKKANKNKKVTAAVKKSIKKRKSIAKKSSASGVKCEFCGKIFKDKYPKNKHVKKFHSTTIVKFQCNHCEYSSCALSTLQTHYRRHHQQQEPPNLSTVSSFEEENSIAKQQERAAKWEQQRLNGEQFNPNERTKCDYCEKTYKHAKHATAHLRECKGYQKHLANQKKNAKKSAKKLIKKQKK